MREEMKLFDVWVSTFFLVDMETKGPPLALAVKHPTVVLVGGKLGGESLSLWLMAILEREVYIRM